MFAKACHILFPAIKIASLSSLVSDVLLGAFSGAQIDHVALVYTLAIEGLFVVLKSTHVEIPVWAETLQDLF